MDPNATLAEIRNLRWQIESSTRVDERSTLAIMLAERVDALDEWLMHGGFLPTAWKIDKMGDR